MLLHSDCGFGLHRVEQILRALLRQADAEQAQQEADSEKKPHRNQTTSGLASGEQREGDVYSRVDRSPSI
jgi:hypothetical protein